MAALRVEVNPDNKPQVHRLAHHEVNAHVHTWRTFVHVSMNRDGTFSITATRDGKNLLPTPFIMSLAEGDEPEEVNPCQ